MIPNVFHFCYGFLPDPQFGFLEYLAIKSAFEINRPERIYFHYQNECSGPWWEKAAEMLTLNRVEAPREIFGRKLIHFAHRSDVLRLRILLEHGGIYMDMDTLCVRPFTPLLGHRCVLGWQSSRGLCNAVILSEPNSEFLKTWLDSYRTFRSTGKDPYWDEHSVLLPARLARQRSMQPHVTLLSHRAFFFPVSDEMHRLFESNDPSGFEESYCVHYCESATRERWLSRITPETVLSGDTNFSRFARRALDGESRDGNINSRFGPLAPGRTSRWGGSLTAALAGARWLDSPRQKARWLGRRIREAVWLPRLISRLGFFAAFGYAANWLRLAAARPSDRPFMTLRSKRAAHPLRCRGYDDLAAFDRVFLHQQYACVEDARDVELIVDCGAQGGYASAYFLTRFPRARLLAVEPYPDQFELLAANLAPYGDRCQAIRAALWSHATRLVPSERAAAGGGQAKYAVREPLDGETPSVDAEDITTLLAKTGCPRISLLRINIGGAEATVFAGDCQAWLDHVDRLVVDLHGEASRSIVEKSLGGGSREVAVHGPVLTAARRMEPLHVRGAHCSDAKKGF